jgi:hypothetical protein
MLENVLVLCPTYDGPTKAGRITLRLLQSRGATLLEGEGCSDIARHRNEICAAAANVLADPPNRFRYVFWVDGDMLISLDDAMRLIEAHEYVRQCVDSDSLVIAGYPTRADWVSAAFAVLNTPDQPTWVDRNIVLKAIGGGLGCAIQGRESFLGQIKQAPDARLSPKVAFPVMCETKTITTSHGRLWRGEDYDYCSRAPGGCWLAVKANPGHQVVGVARMRGPAIEPL